ncbi:MAG: hypothetical protein Q9157_001030 [Trypethelium eluteriae]
MLVFVVILLSLSYLTNALLHPARPESLQTPMNDVNLDDVRAILKDAEIIPTVLDDFDPSITIQVSWGNATAKLGNTISPSELQDAPKIALLSSQASISGGAQTAPSNIVLALTDPDAPSRSNPKWSEMCHWIAANLTLPSSSFPAPGSDANIHQGPGDDLVPYKPPGPPPKTGKHRYVFIAFKPANGTSSPLNLTAPSERQHWGTGKQEHGVRDWAGKNGLVPIGK